MPGLGTKGSASLLPGLVKNLPKLRNSTRQYSAFSARNTYVAPLLQSSASVSIKSSFPDSLPTGRQQSRKPLLINLLEVNSIGLRIEEREAERKRLVLRGIPPSALLLWAKCHKSERSLSSDSLVCEVREEPASVLEVKEPVGSAAR